MPLPLGPRASPPPYAGSDFLSVNDQLRIFHMGGFSKAMVGKVLTVDPATGE